MSKYNTIHSENPFLEDIYSRCGFFERYLFQLHDIYNTGLDFKTIWHQFCKVNDIVPKKPWQLSNHELKRLERLRDHEIFLFLAEAIGNFWKAGYKGDGF